MRHGLQPRQVLYLGEKKKNEHYKSFWGVVLATVSIRFYPTDTREQEATRWGGSPLGHFFFFAHLPFIVFSHFFRSPYPLPRDVTQTRGHYTGFFLPSPLRHMLSF